MGSLPVTSLSADLVPENRPDIKLLQASVDPNQISDFRILVEGTSIRYLTIDPGIYEVNDMCFGPSLMSMLPPLPSGEWNQGHISYDTEAERPIFASIKNDALPGVTHRWHSLQLDYLELQMVKKIRSNVYEATCSRFNSTVIAKFALFAWEVAQIDAETAAYQRIENHDIGPKFLGHLSEKGRIIGFILQHIPDYQHAAPKDLDICQAALSKLHRLGIKHGDTNKHNFLIHNGRATIIDFDCAEICADTMSLEAELQGLQKELQDTSSRGWQTVIT